MQKISIADARDQFADVINQVAYGGNRVVLTRHEKEIVAVIPIADLEKLALLEQKIDVEDAKRALSEVNEKGGMISLGDLLEEMDLES